MKTEALIALAFNEFSDLRPVIASRLSRMAVTDSFPLSYETDDCA
jgi:hypothetical protein